MGYRADDQDGERVIGDSVLKQEEIGNSALKESCDLPEELQGMQAEK